MPFRAIHIERIHGNPISNDQSRRVDLSGAQAVGLRQSIYEIASNLIANDLKHGAGEGGVALWIGAGSEGFFSNLRIAKR